MNPVGIDYITLYGMDPIAYVETCAAAGAQTVALMTALADPAPPGAVPYSLLGNPVLCRQLGSRVAGLGMRIGLLDGLAVWPGRSVRDYEPSLADFARMGITLANTVSFDSPERSVDEFALLAELARPHGIRIVLESCPVLTVRTLAEAERIARQLAEYDFGLLIDTMHVCRTGEAGLVAELDPALIGYVQICDASAIWPETDALYMDQAMNERQVPGEGELPLEAILRAVPQGVPISGEVPLRGRKAAGWSPRQCAEAVIAGTRQVLSAARAG